MTREGSAGPFGGSLSPGSVFRIGETSFPRLAGGFAGKATAHKPFVALGGSLVLRHPCKALIRFVVGRGAALVSTLRLRPEVTNIGGPFGGPFEQGDPHNSRNRSRVFCIVSFEGTHCHHWPTGVPNLEPGVCGFVSKRGCLAHYFAGVPPMGPPFWRADSVFAISGVPLFM